MTITFYGKLTEYTDGDKTLTPLPGVCTTLRELLDFLCKHYGERFEAFIKGSETCLILINGNGITLSGGLDSPLKQGDKVEMMPFVDAG